MGESNAIRTGRFLVQTPIGAQPGLETQPCNEALVDHQAEFVGM